MDNAMNLTFGVSLTARRVGEVTRPARTFHRTAVSGLGGDTDNYARGKDRVFDLLRILLFLISFLSFYA